MIDRSTGCGSEHRDHSGDQIPLAMTDATLGHLDLSGPWFAVSLLGQF